ncbi:MAG: hypothetical protein H0X43_12330 [Nitrosospira sp.]|nr:hypothetical protein [Nitrosospira sp.]
MNIPEFWKCNLIFAILLMGIPGIALSGQTKTPLKASLVTQEKVDFMPNCPSKFGGTTTGTGKSTHLGKVTLTASDCVTPREDHFTFDGTFTLIAANGDTLTGDYSGAFIPTNTGSMYRLSDATFKITGGTGRFIRATGSAELTGNQDIQTGEGKIEADGMISY